MTGAVGREGLPSALCNFLTSVVGQRWHAPLRGSFRTSCPAEYLPRATAVLGWAPSAIAWLSMLDTLPFFIAFVLSGSCALPIMPFALSCGYKFGFSLGLAVALTAMACAATISFFLARTVLRPVVKRMFAESKVFQLVNRAVKREGFKIILLSRCSPVMPFAPANFAYGLSNVNYVIFIIASVLGLLPGTALSVYMATTAAARQVAGPTERPWYTYAAAIGVTLLSVKVVSDAAKRALQDAVDDTESDG